MSTQFSFEVPLNHLQDFQDLQDFNFTLSILFNEAVYAEHFAEQKKKGEKTLWLDNSYNELMEPGDSIHMTILGQHINADKIICPDSPQWPTEYIWRSFLQMAKFLPLSQIVVVASSKEMRSEMERRNAKHFAVSYWVRQNLDVYQKWYEGCHFLGLLSPQEILMNKPPTCDTSMPIKLALNGWDLDRWKESGYVHVHTKDLGERGENFFHYQMSDEQVKLARDNIKQLKEEVKW